MQDRFQFRVWKGLENRMVYNVTHLNPMLLDPRIDKLNIHNIPMQCTGLRDKDNRLIYEGDIVKVTHVTPMGTITEQIGVVEWKYYGFSMTYLNGYGSVLYHEDNIYELLGNIYENKELLNEGN